MAKSGDIGPHYTWRDDLIEWSLMAVTSPLWVPPYAVAFVVQWYRIRGFLGGSVESAWSKCSELWRSLGYVTMQTPHIGAPFSHSLAVAFGKSYRRDADFLVKQLRNDDPVLVGYAFKCLIRARPGLVIEDIPADVLDRTEKIPILWADLGWDQPIQEFIAGYFMQSEHRAD